MTNIQKQQGELLFPEIDWEKPQNAKQKGNLLIVGGSPHGFASVANSYEYAKEAGIGSATVVFPEALRATVKDFVEHAEYLPSTPSGSFSKQGLVELLAMASNNWATLLAGEFGRNSETSALLESFVMQNSGRIALSKDAVEYASASFSAALINRPETLIVASFSQLQKLLQAAKVQENIRFEMSLHNVAEFLASFTQTRKAHVITVHHNHVFSAMSGNVSITALPDEELLWQSRVAAYASVFWLQHPTKSYEALTSAIFESIH